MLVGAASHCAISRKMDGAWITAVQVRSSCHFGSSAEQRDMETVSRGTPLKMMAPFPSAATRTTTVHGIHGQTDPLLSPGTAAVCCPPDRGYSIGDPSLIADGSVADADAQWMDGWRRRARTHTCVHACGRKDRKGRESEIGIRKKSGRTRILAMIGCTCPAPCNSRAGH